MGMEGIFSAGREEKGKKREECVAFVLVDGSGPGFHSWKIWGSFGGYLKAGYVLLSDVTCF